MSFRSAKLLTHGCPKIWCIVGTIIPCILIFTTSITIVFTVASITGTDF